MIDLILSLIGAKGAAIIAAIVGILSVLGVRTIRDRRAGAKRERDRAQQEDYEHAADINRRAGNAGKRVRDHDDAGWRD